MKSLLFAMILMLGAPSAFAYEPHLVHRKMGKNGFDAALQQYNFLKPLGWTSDEFLPRYWVGQGAADQDEWFWNASRHFLDPINGIPLTVPSDNGPCPGEPLDPSGRADHWAIDHPVSNRDLVRARDELYNALTRPTPTERELSFMELFRTLGHVVHLVQDMAQPEHTRNDNHAPPPIGNMSWYEKYSKALVSLQFGHTQQQIDAMFLGYPVVTLPAYEDYFHTTEAAVPQRKGMADYANRNFVTQDSNFNWYSRLCPVYDYALPSLADTTETVEERTQWVFVFPSMVFVPRTFTVTTYRHLPQDAYLGEEDVNPALTVGSFLNSELQIFFPFLKYYAENLESYSQKTRLLFPRAVGYSAGVISRFFRGKLDAHWAVHPDYPDQATVTIRNLSEDPITAASLEIFGDNSTTADVTLEKIFTGPAPYSIPPNGQLVVEVTGFSLDLGPNENIRSRQRHIVFRGTLGNEEDAVVGLVQPGERGVLKVVRFRPSPNPARLDEIAVGGDGTFQLVKNMAAGSEPWMTFDASDGDISSNGRRIAVASGSEVRIYDAQTFALLSSFQAKDAENYPISIEMGGHVRFSDDALRVAVLAYKECRPSEPCWGISLYNQPGIAIMNIQTGVTDFRFIPALVPLFPASGITHSADADWSANSRYFFFLDENDYKIRRIDLQTNSVDVMVGFTGSWGFTSSSDGNTTYMAEFGAAGGVVGKYDWTTPGWTALTNPPARIAAPTILSPAGDEIAYLRYNMSCGGFQIWTHSLFDSTSKPISEQPCGAVTPETQGAYDEIFWPLK